MSKPYKIILVISILSTIRIFIHEWMYDYPGNSYGISQIIQDIIFGGLFYTGIQFGVFSAIFYLFSYLFKLATGITNP